MIAAKNIFAAMPSYVHACRQECEKSGSPANLANMTQHYMNDTHLTFGHR